MRLAILLTFACFLVLCSEFPNTFDRIDSNDVRLLDCIFEPAEASPGDTIKLTAVFAGKKFSSSDISWQYSKNFIVNKYGMDTAFDIVPLSQIPVETDYLNDAKAYSFSFVIPADIFKTHGQIPNNWYSVLPDSVTKLLPDTLKNLSKNELIDLLDILTVSPQVYSLIVEQLQLPDDTLSSLLLPLISQFFTVQIRFFADVKGELKSLIDYSVRYNSRFSKIPQIGVKLNKNPRIDSIGIYIVEGNRDEYDPDENKHQFIRIDIGDGSDNIVPVKDNHSYFLVAFHDHPDSLKTIFDILNWENDDYHLERLETIWFFQLDDNETKDISENRYMKTEIRTSKNFNDLKGKISRSDLQSISKLTPPKDKAIKSIKLWCQIRDESLNEYLRPTGSNLKGGAFTFQY